MLGLYVLRDEQPSAKLKSVQEEWDLHNYKSNSKYVRTCTLSFTKAFCFFQQTQIFHAEQRLAQ